MVDAGNKCTKHWCNDNDREKLMYVEKNYSSATLSTTNST